MSQFFRKGGIALNDTEWIQDFADRRLQYGVSQTKLAVMAGISREHLSRIESGKVAVTERNESKTFGSSGKIQSRSTAYHAV